MDSFYAAFMLYAGSVAAAFRSSKTFGGLGKDLSADYTHAREFAKDAICRENVHKLINDYISNIHHF